MFSNSNAIAPLPPAMTLTIGSNAITVCQNQDVQQPEQLDCAAALPTVQANSITGPANWNVLAKLRSLYTISNPEQVFLFLNDQIAELLVDAEAVIREHFETSRVGLEVRPDPEGTNDVLLVSIYCNLCWQESEKLLEGFDRCWWLSRSWIPSNKKICIDVRRT